MVNQEHAEGQPLTEEIESQEKTELEILEEVYAAALQSYQGDAEEPALSEPYKGHSEVIVDNQENNKGVLAVLITLLLKKIHDQDQDIRIHQAGMEKGFSGRGLDSKVVTPFLRDQNFPHMSSGSGWLTRSLEQAQPYNLSYTGNITPAKVKAAFLNLVDGVQCHGLSPENLLAHIFQGLIIFRDKNTNLVLSRPVNLSVSEVVEKVAQHHSLTLPGVARLPVLAMHAILTILASETNRYRNCTVLPLEHHTASDSSTELIGDIHISDANGTLFEGYEIKHNIPITSDLIQTSFDKFKTTPVRRFYILTTYQHDNYVDFEPDVQMVAQSHGCQLILNGVDRTLGYYLRLIEDTPRFVHEYVTNIENDASITYQLKQAWNDIVQG